MTTQCPGRRRRKVHIKFFTPHYCNKSGRFKSGLTNQFLPNASIPESIWTRSSGLPRSNSQRSIYVAYFRRSQQSFDEARSKCPGNETPTTDPIYDGSSAPDQNFANPGPEADHPAVSVPVTTNEESDEDAIPEFDDSEKEDQFTSHIFAPDDLNTSTDHWCGTCGVLFRHDQIERHLISSKHVKNEKRILQQAREPEVPVSSSVQW